MKIIAIIPCRGGSKGVPRKNIKKLAGKPLIYYSIMAARDSKLIDEVYVSTEDAEIIDISRKYKAKVIVRPDKLSGDKTPTLPVLKHALEYVDADIVVMLQATSPIRTSELIDQAIKKLIKLKCESVITVVKFEKQLGGIYYLLKNDKMKFALKEFRSVTLRQQQGNLYIREGNVFVNTKEALLKSKNLCYGKDVHGIVIPKLYGCDIDSIEDFMYTESLLKRLPKKFWKTRGELKCQD